jgi:hypothetical protein
LAPPDDFLARVETGVVQRGRRRRLWTGTAVALVALLLWGSALLGTLSLGALLLSRQAVWLSEAVHGAALWWAGLSATAAALWGSMLTLLGTPQAQMAMVCYALVAALILLLWFSFLRRSLHAAETAA